MLMDIVGVFYQMSGKMTNNNSYSNLQFDNIVTPSEYAKIARGIDSKNLQKKIKVCYLASYTAEILNPYIVVELARKNFNSSLYFAPFNQFEQEIHNSKSGLHSFNPDVVIFHNRIEDNYQDLLVRFSSYSKEMLDHEADNIIKRQKILLEGLRLNSDAKIIVINFGDILISNNYISSSPIIQSQNAFLQKLNNSLFDLCNQISSCFVISYQQIFNDIGLQNSVDPKLFYMARIPFNSNAQIAFGKVISRTISAIYNIPAKCLVLDLDNTLWGGVIGEDGIAGISLSDEYPGNVYKDFQRTLLGLRDQGTLLSVASKNNIDDALEVFEKHSDCLIKVSDFSAIQIHWKDKASSIKKIAEELNIGLDSLVFFDDNPVERDWVRKQLPEVKVVEVPKNPMNYSKSLIESTFFDSLTITNEDRFRADIYYQEKQRKSNLENSVSVDDFLKDLKMSIQIGILDDITLSRVIQLINKTNQFNLTTKRYSLEDVNKIVLNGGKVFWVRASDRFGDNGIIGVSILLNTEPKAWFIDSLLLSCRIIGRKIESAFLSEIVKILKSENADYIYGHYIPTKKNAIVKDFYKNHDFQLSNKNEKIWKFNINDNFLVTPNYIKVSINND